MKERGMKRILRDERGMALAVAIFALVVVGALVAGAFFAGTQEQRVGENQRRVQTSFGVAEAGVQERVTSWQPDSMNKRQEYPQDSVPIYSLAAAATAPGGTGRYFGYSYKLGSNIFLIDVTGRDQASANGVIAGGSGARQRIGMITRLAPVDFGIHASLTTQGGVNLTGNADVNGNDQNPAGWLNCDPSGPPQAGIRDPGANVGTSGNGSVQGNPPVVNDPSINNNSFTNFGGATYAQLAARATITLGPGTYKTNPNFGGPTGCDKTYHHFPRELYGKLADLGLMGVCIPEEYGGAGADFLSYVLVLEELSRADAGVGVTVAVHTSAVTLPILTFGTDEQRSRFVPPLARGEAMGAFALTEPEAGSDAGSLRTSAPPDGDGWRISGAKQWISTAEHAGTFLLFARTDQETPGAAGISSFILDADHVRV